MTLFSRTLVDVDLCRVDEIDKKTHEIRQDEDQVTYKSLEDIAEDLPDNTPRFVLLSYPMTLVCLLCCLGGA